MAVLKPWTWFGGRSRTLSRDEGIQHIEPAFRASSLPQPVNFDSAMQLSAFWAAARLWAETLASIPVKIQVMRDGDWVDDIQSDLSVLLNTRMNRYQNRVEFFESFVLNHMVHGNAYALKVRSGTRLVGLLPLNSGQVFPELLKDGTLVYNYHTDRGVNVLASDSVWHWKMFGNGVVGLSPLGYGKHSVSVGLSADKRIGQVFRNAGKPAGILTIDGTLTEEQRSLVREKFKTLVEGPTDTLMVLEAAMKFQPTSLSPTDIELLDSRRFQVEDVARFMDVPSVLINDTAGTTAWGTGIGEIIRGWYKRSVRARANSLQESMRSHLIPIESRRNSRVMHDFDDLLKLDKKERMESHQRGINSGVLTPNEARKQEDLPPLERGDILYANGAIVPLGSNAGTTVQEPTDSGEMNED